MAFIPIPNSVQVCFHFTTGGQNWQFCMVLKKDSGSPNSTDLDNLSSAGDDWFATDLKPLISSDTTLNNITATNMTVDGGPQATDISGSVGTAATAALPLSTAVVVSLRTAKRGRSYRGRVYVGGIPKGVQNSSVDVTSAYVDDLLEAFAAWDTQVGVLGYSPVVASKQHNLVPTNPAETNLVNAFSADLHMDAQRRRLAGRGT